MKIDWTNRFKADEEMMDYQARIYYGAELADEQKKCQDEAQNLSERLREVLFGHVEEEIHQHFRLIADRITKSIMIGGSAVFIHPHANYVINTVYTGEEFCRLASENGNAIIVYNRPDGTVIPNDEPIGKKEAD